MPASRGLRYLLVTVFMLGLFSFSAVAKENDCLYYFYGTNCDDCPPTDTFMSQLQSRYSELEVHLFEVHYSQENSNRLDNFYAKYQVAEGSRALPVVFIGETYFIGKDSIRTLLEQRILDNTNRNCPNPDRSGVIGVIGMGSPTNIVKTLTFGVVTGSALSNSFNTGILAVFLVLLFLTLFIKEDEQLLKKGFLFIGSVALAYFLFGWGLFSILLAPIVSLVFIKVVGLVVSIAAAVIIIDFFWHWKWLSKNFSDTSRIRLTKAWKKVSSYPGVLLLGLLSGFLSAGTASSTFMTMRNLLKGSVGKTVVVPLLIYYLIILLLGISIIVVVLYLLREKVHTRVMQKVPMSDMKREAWKKHIIRVFNVVISFILLVLGLVALFA